ncbi:hypothetical protein J2T57_003601 [Natronocella acetinitrilica]|uniref:Uncharacterized protein n=1 Tax=Natronocella acetinitrilica TaxID=414046 RepID=A0AAE3G612_9GAMM|nr:hypothetical protein [Natronocella acetinitrilica]
MVGVRESARVAIADLNKGGAEQVAAELGEAAVAARPELVQR